MARVSINETVLNNIAEAIRDKLGTQTEYAPQNMAAAIKSIEGLNLMAGNIIANGIYTPSGEKNGFSSVTVNVPTESATLISKTITQNGTYNPASDNADGYDSVTVNVQSGSSGPIQYMDPHVENLTTGYVANGTWMYTTNYPNLNTTVFEVEAGNDYLFMAGAVSERFGVMFTTVDISQVTSNVTGEAVASISNADPYEAISYSPVQNGYVAIYVGDRSKHVYGFEGSLQ